ncbi:MAG TPA: Flp pilus assembly protein CpaB [Kineosporiaceae bacterium]|nr:Flp pilus assembly protein CpaB [Kineosporiaceae bacterium]
MAVAALGAVAVFFLVLNYVSSISSQVGPMTTAYRFVKAVPRLKVISDADLERVEVPVRWVPDAAIQSFDTTRGLVAVEDVPQGALLQQGMAGPPPELQPGQREIAILINAETGVAGKIRPGDLVDIYATFSDQNGNDKNTQARVIVPNAPVLAIGQLQRADAPNADGTRFQQSEVVPVTFALTVKDSLKVTYAESYATKVRLALIAPGTRSTVTPGGDVLSKAQIFAVTPAPAAKKAKP